MTFSATEWKKLVAPYQKQSMKRAAWQIANSFVPYIALWFLAVWSLDVSYLLTLGLVTLNAAFMVRIFIMVHDCGHGSFFASKKANDILGFIGGVITFTPYFWWTHTHAIHHATSSNLDRRGVGDIWTLTVQEYKNASKGLQLKYRLFRNPFVMFVAGPIYMFFFTNRFAGRKAERRWKIAVLWSNVALFAFAGAMIALVGLGPYLLIQLPMVFLAAVGGIWLFYMQHQFEGNYWERQDKWQYIRGAMEGSSYYKLPRILQWFSGNIGFHHIHHLSPRIPNYFLDKCHHENPVFQKVTTLNIRESLHCLTLRLYDEEQRKMVTFSAVS